MSVVLKLKSVFRNWIRSGFRPEAVGRSEWFFMRLSFACVIGYMLEDARPFALETQKHANGLANLVDLTWLSDDLPWESPFNNPGLWDIFAAVTVVLLIFYVVGRGLWIVLPLLVLVFTLPHSLQNSQGYILHKFQLITLTILAQAVVVNYAKWFRQKRENPLSADMLRGWVVYYSKGMIAATYVTSVVSKLINSKGLWLWKTGYMAVDQQKSRAQEFYRSLDPAFSGIDPIAAWMVDHTWLTRALFGTGFFLEFAALAALHSRKWALLIGISLIAMHRSIAAVMNLDFLNHELVVLIFFVNIPFWMMWVGAKIFAPSTLEPSGRV